MLTQIPDVTAKGTKKKQTLTKALRENEGRRKGGKIPSPETRGPRQMVSQCAVTGKAVSGVKVYELTPFSKSVKTSKKEEVSAEERSSTVILYTV